MLFHLTLVSKNLSTTLRTYCTVKSCRFTILGGRVIQLLGSGMSRIHWSIPNIASNWIPLGLIQVESCQIPCYVLYRENYTMVGDLCAMFCTFLLLCNTRSYRQEKNMSCLWSHLRLLMPRTLRYVKKIRQTKDFFLISPHTYHWNLK